MGIVEHSDGSPLVLLTGATGYIGGRLLKDLEASGNEFRQRCPPGGCPVEEFDADRRLRLVAEMKIPGRAWLEFEVAGDSAQSTIRQTAIFDPLGLFGLIYWYGLYPLHRWIFAGMLRKIAEASVSAANANSFRAA